MWVRSQDRKLLIDVDNIYVGMGFGDKVEIYKIGEHFNYHLGWYSDEKKALKVLDAIEDSLESPYNYVFQMPQDKEVEI